MTPNSVFIYYSSVYRAPTGSVELVVDLVPAIAFAGLAAMIDDVNECAKENNQAEYGFDVHCLLLSRVWLI